MIGFGHMAKKAPEKQAVRDILFSGSGPLSWAHKEVVAIIGVKMLNEMKDKRFAIKTIQIGLSDDPGHYSLANQIYHFLSKWDQNDKKQVREFIISELEEILNQASARELARGDLEDPSKAKLIKGQLKSDHRQIKKELERLLIKKFGPEFGTLTAQKLKVNDYAVVRFFREDRIPTRETLVSFFKALGIEDLRYQRL
jgi:hypothetical protein